MKNTNRPTESTKGKIAIVDSQAASRIGLWRHIERLNRWEIGWASSTAEEAMEKLGKDAPAALILEIQLTGKDGLEFIKDLQPLYPELKILVYSSLSEDFYAERCLRAGALGYLHKNKPMHLFQQALDKVIGGDIYLSSRITRKTLHSLSTHHGYNNNDNHLHQLTDRELEIMILMAQGLSSQMSADKLRISPRTVQVHRNNIRHKVGLESSLQLHSYAVRFYGDSAKTAGTMDNQLEEEAVVTLIKKPTIHRLPRQTVQKSPSAAVRTGRTKPKRTMPSAGKKKSVNLPKINSAYDKTL